MNCKFLESRKFFIIGLLIISFTVFSSAQTLKENGVKTVETGKVDLKGCIQMFGSERFVINSKADYLEYIRKDVQRDECTKNAENLDFEKYTYLGLEINSGYCRRPIGLRFSTEKDPLKKQYTLNVSYEDPQGAVCRARSQYDLWVSIPKIPEIYEVDFKVTAYISDP